jgi:hypothetical protein
MTCPICARPVRSASPHAMCLRCRATFVGLRLVDVVDEVIDASLAPDTVVALGGYPPSLREVTVGDDD